VSVGAFLGIFALMFVLELPDKTMVAMVVMSTRARARSIVIGASAAFIVQTALAVSVGGLIALLPLRVKDAVVATLFLGGAAYLLLVSEKHEETEGERQGEREQSATVMREVLTAFSVVFIGEFGDLTQIQAANLSAKTHQPLEVFIAGSIALIGVTFLASYGGQMLQRVVPLQRIRQLGGLVFLGLGMWTLVELATA
jgi:putative Ca2+/H+ antiporter (TMEM165/GDT1 family)